LLQQCFLGVRALVRTIQTGLVPDLLQVQRTQGRFALQQLALEQLRVQGVQGRTPAAT
jgi:uncharacterized protein YjiS (DUF1127 family)